MGRAVPSVSSFAGLGPKYTGFEPIAIVRVAAGLEPIVEIRGSVKHTFLH